jgi:hypothetical protein
MTWGRIVSDPAIKSDSSAILSSGGRALAFCHCIVERKSVKSEPYLGNAKAGETRREGIKNGEPLCRLSGRAKSGLAARRRETSERDHAIRETARLATPFLQRWVLRDLR